MAVDIELRQQTVGEVLRLLEARNGRVIDPKEEEGFWREVIQICQYFGVGGKLSTDPTEVLGILKAKVSFENEELGLDEVVEELKRRIGEAFEEPDLSAKVDTATLRELLEKMDDANARRDLGAEATRLESIYGEYLRKPTIEEILKAKIAYHRRAEEELKRLRPEVSAEKIRELADKRTDAQIVAEGKLLHEANRSPEEAKVLAQEIAEIVVEPNVKRVEVMARFESQPEEVRMVVEDVVVSEEIREKLGDRATPEMLRLAKETEEKLRGILKEEAVEITVAVINGTKPEEAIPEDIKIEKKERERAVNELKTTERIRDTEAVIKQKENVVVAELAKVLGVEGDEVAVNELRQEVGERIRLVLKNGGDLNQPILTPVTGVERMVAPMRMTDKINKAVETEIPAGQKDEVLSILKKADGELRQYQDILDWRERFIKRDVFYTVVVANPGVSVAVAEKFAGDVAKVYGSDSGVLEVERQTWREANLAGQVNPLHEAYLNTITSLVRSPISIQNRRQSFEGAEGIDTRGEMMAQAYQGVMGLMEDPGIASKFESARRIYQMTKGVQGWLTGRMADIPVLGNFAKSLSADLGGIGYAQQALGVLKNSKTLVEATKGILGLVGGSGAGGAVASGAAALGLSATGVGAIVVVAAALGKVAGWLGGKIQGFFSKLGIDIPNIGGLIGGITGFLGLKGGLGGLVKGVPGLVTKAGVLGANFAAGLMGAISTAMAGLSISSVAIWGPIVGILVFVLIIIGPLISAMVPPGRRVGGAVVDQTTLNGGYLAAPPWSGDINDLPDSCPPQTLPIGGTVTQGPDARDCSHLGYKNVIDVAGPKDNILSTHDGVVEAVIDMGNGYGQYVDIRGRCGTTTFVTRYAHMVVGSARVVVGDKIAKETIIGTRNNSGNSSGDHLHYEIRGLTTEYFHDWEGCCISNGVTCKN